MCMYELPILMLVMVFFLLDQDERRNYCKWPPKHHSHKVGFKYNWSRSSRTDHQNVKCIQRRADNWTESVNNRSHDISRSNVRTFYLLYKWWDYYIYSSPFLIKSNTICLTCNYYDSQSQTHLLFIVSHLSQTHGRKGPH